MLKVLLHFILLTFIELENSCCCFFTICLFPPIPSIQFSSSSLCHPYSMLLWFFFTFCHRFFNNYFLLVLFTSKCCVSALFSLRHYSVHKFYMSFTMSTFCFILFFVSLSLSLSSIWFVDNFIDGFWYIYQMIRIDEGFVNVTKETNKYFPNKPQLRINGTK